MTKTTGTQILLVDDDDVDVDMIQRALERSHVASPVTVARDGLEALEVLRGGPDRPPLPRPYLILLDLDMPRMNGLEFLDELRADARLKDSVVFVLTTSSRGRDVAAAYQRHVAGYMVKQDAQPGFPELVGLLAHYRKVVELPGA